MTVASCKKKIEALTNKETFYDDVREIVGYHTGYLWKDCEIKELQRIADARYTKMGGK